MSSDVTANGIVKDYLDAIGGQNKLKAIKSLHTSMKTNMMGQEATFETYQVAPDKFAMKVNMMGMTVQEQRYDGVKGMQAQMGNKKVITEGKELEDLKKQTVVFEQLNYTNTGYKLELKGIESVEGNNCYKVIVTDPAGATTTEYYDVKSSYLVRSVKSQAGQGGESVSITTDFKDYKDAGGILMPYTTTIIGAMPVPLILEAILIEVDKGISQEVFKVE
ncbi:MAG: hypothetical protein IPL08_10370 [Saprospiraceae bacterium]|nr:hypothetical protein [Saprospiraceae bacterium]